VKMPKWLRWGDAEKSSETKAENLKKVRQQTDQMMKQQNVQKERRDDAEQGQSP
jgi:hypothetical protein